MKPVVRHARTHERAETLYPYNKSLFLATLELMQEQQAICSPGSLSQCLSVLPVGPGFARRELALVGGGS